jgi:hypothetical protein
MDTPILPRPDHTTHAIMILLDSGPELHRRLALEDMFKQVLEKWTPGNDLSIVIRQPTAEEAAVLKGEQHGT